MNDGEIGFSCTYYPLLCIVYWTFMKIYLWVYRQWWPIANTCANVSPCPFNFTVLLHINSSRQSWSISALYAKKNVTKARTLLYTAVHDLSFWCVYHSTLHHISKKNRLINWMASHQKNTATNCPLRYNICSTWFLAIRISTCYKYINL